MQQTVKKKIRLALLGNSAALKLYSSLKLAFGLCGSWSRVIVIGSSPKDNIYQHLGPHNTLDIAVDAPPQRYIDLLNLCAGAGKEVVIFSTFSEEWQHGVTTHVESSYYPQVLQAHRSLLGYIQHSPMHIICCVETRKKLSTADAKGKLRLGIQQVPIQQEGFEQCFTAVLQLDKKGKATVRKDETNQLVAGEPVPVNPQLGAQLQDWCYANYSDADQELQSKINSCQSLSELYQLLFDLEIDDVELISAFTRRRLELDEQNGIESCKGSINKDLETVSSDAP